MRSRRCRFLIPASYEVFLPPGEKHLVAVSRMGHARVEHTFTMDGPRWGLLSFRQSHEEEESFFFKLRVTSKQMRFW